MFKSCLLKAKQTSCLYASSTILLFTYKLTYVRVDEPQSSKLSLNFCMSFCKTAYTIKYSTLSCRYPLLDAFYTCRSHPSCRHQACDLIMTEISQAQTSLNKDGRHIANRGGARWWWWRDGSKYLSLGHILESS